MPRKTKKRLNKKLSKKMAIQNRLMQLTLRVDEHIYQGRLIAATDAARLAREVRLMRRDTGGDVRLLQVADKLIRIMKSIVEGVSSLQETNNLTSITSSHIDRENIIRDISNLENISEFNNTTQKTKGHTANTGATSSEIDGITTSNICRAISTLSIEECSIKPTHDLPIESQSILINFVEHGVHVGIAQNNLVEEDVENKIISNNNELFDDLTQIELSQHELRHKRDINTASLSETIRHITKLTTREKQVHNKTNTKITKKEIKHKENIPATKKVKKEPKLKENTLNITEKRNHANNHTRRAKKTVIDMSWVENIKYVRVVEAAEWSPGGCADSFWSTLDLPQDWDDGDFLFP